MTITRNHPCREGEDVPSVACIVDAFCFQTAIADDNLKLFAADINVQTVLTFQVSDAVEVSDAVAERICRPAGNLISGTC